MIEKIHAEGYQTRNDLNYFLTELKESESWLCHYYSKMLQMISTQANSAQKSLIQLEKNGHKVGALKFAKHNQYNAFVYNQSGYKIEDKSLHLSKLGKFRLVQHRSISENCTIKQIAISRSKTGKWHAFVMCKVDLMLPKSDKSIGIDLGITNFAYDSDGLVTSNPLNLERMLKPLARAHRKIMRRHEGSKNRKKAIRFYQIIHERIKNRRKDFLHKISTQYSRRYGTIFIERLQKLNMTKNHNLARNILDSGWSIFAQMLAYKAKLIEVPAHYTSLECSECGTLVPKTLSVRIHSCNNCGLVLDRDHNAAINILKRGLETSHKLTMTVPQELRELTPVEILTRSRKQEATTSKW